LDSTSDSRRNGRYFVLISASSSFSEIDRLEHCAKVRSPLEGTTIEPMRTDVLVRIEGRRK
jgi:hypothetical protein